MPDRYCHNLTPRGKPPRKGPKVPPAQADSPGRPAGHVDAGDGATRGQAATADGARASLTEAAAKAASGALESVPVVRVKNLGRALEQLKEADYWIYGLDSEAAVDYDAIEYSDRCALVLGGESRGMREKVAERCDFVVRIPLAGAVTSLNVSVATGIALFEVGRQRRSQARIERKRHS